MKILLIGAILASSVLVGCGGGGDDSADDVITELKAGETTVETMKEIESILANNKEIKEDQIVTFVLPEDNQTLKLTTDLIVKGTLVIK